MTHFQFSGIAACGVEDLPDSPSVDKTRDLDAVQCPACLRGGIYQYELEQAAS